MSVGINKGDYYRGLSVEAFQDVNKRANAKGLMAQVTRREGDPLRISFEIVTLPHEAKT